MQEKKVWFKNSRGQKLCGILHLPAKDTNLAILIAHGVAANKDMERLIIFSNKLAEQGYASFRFDFGGSGESEIRPITLEAQIDDLDSAINYLKKQYSSVGVIGESFGALTVESVYDSRIDAMILLSAITAAKHPYSLRKKEVIDKLNKTGYFEFTKDGQEFSFTKQYLDERLNVNQKELLSKIKIPVLLIHGDKDIVIPLSDSKKALQYLPKGSKLEVITGATHTLNSAVDEVIKLILEWFKEHLK